MKQMIWVYSKLSSSYRNTGSQLEVKGRILIHRQWARSYDERNDTYNAKFYIETALSGLIKELYKVLDNFSTKRAISNKEI